jgi:hypothetical protein
MNNQNPQLSQISAKQKKWYRHKGILTIIILTAIIIGFMVFVRIYSSTHYSEDGWLIKGQVVVEFKKNLSINDINSFLSKNNFQSLTKITNIQTFKVISDISYDSSTQELENNLKLLKNKNIVSQCKPATQLQGLYKMVQADCEINQTMPLQSIAAAISQIGDRYFVMLPGVDILSTISIKVPVGTEQEWVKKLQQYPEVESTIQNGYL